MKLKIPNPLVSVNWLNKNIKAENLIVLDATIIKVDAENDIEKEKLQIPNSIFFDLKNIFLNKEGEFPNTIPTKNHFEEQVQNLGINKDSCIVIYDDLGVYSSARAWWLFDVFGFENVAVLNGGFPSWLKASYSVDKLLKKQLKKGDFRAVFKTEKISNKKRVLEVSNNKGYIFDARSKERFKAIVAEPRKGLRGGHIPNSKSLPYSQLQNKGEMKPIEELNEIFLSLNPEKKPVVFSCGSGITACILALGSCVSGNKNYTVYDGSWTEWASDLTLPIEK